jgi:hypothetical protein
MKPMNGILADIVIASGGTVTATTRNGLLQNWLAAVESPAALAFTSQPQATTVDEYAIATFSCEVTGGVAPYSYQYKKNGANVGADSSTLSFAAAATDNAASITVVVTDSVGSVITSTAAVLSVTSYAYQFDGVTQYASLSSSVALIVGDKVSVTVGFGGATSSFRTIFDSESSSSRTVLRTLGGVWDIIGGTLKVDGVDRVSGDVAPLSGFHLIEFTSLGTGNVKYVGNNFAFSAYGEFKIYNLNITRAAGNVLLPLNNKSQGANQLATVGGISATIVNYNADGWVAI